MTASTCWLRKAERGIEEGLPAYSSSSTIPPFCLRQSLVFNGPTKRTVLQVFAPTQHLSRTKNRHQRTEFCCFYLCTTRQRRQQACSRIESGPPSIEGARNGRYVRQRKGADANAGRIVNDTTGYTSPDVFHLSQNAGPFLQFLGLVYGVLATTKRRATTDINST